MYRLEVVFYLMICWQECQIGRPIRSMIHHKQQRHASQDGGVPKEKKQIWPALSSCIHSLWSLCSVEKTNWRICVTSTKGLKVPCRKREHTNARMQAVTPVPQEVTTGLSKEIPAETYVRRITANLNFLQNTFKSSSIVTLEYWLLRLHWIVWHSFQTENKNR